MFRDTNMRSTNRPLNEPAENSRPHNGVIALRRENIRPIRHGYEDFRSGQRKGPDDIVVLD